MTTEWILIETLNDYEALDFLRFEQEGSLSLPIKGGEYFEQFIHPDLAYIFVF